MKLFKAHLYLKDSSSSIFGTLLLIQTDMIGSHSEQMQSNMVPEILYLLLLCQQLQHLKFWEIMRALNLIHPTCIQEEFLRENLFVSTNTLSRI